MPLPAKHAQHEAAAERAGLRYVTDSIPGIAREGQRGDWVYVGPDGKRITTDAKLDRIRSLAIPPAWTDVWICPFANGHLQVTARDVRGRKQYRYHEKYRAVRDETKFDRMVDFSRVLPGARIQVETDLGLTGLTRRRVLAALVWLLEKTLIRIGNVTYAKENDSFGLTTLRTRHAKVSGSRMLFSFSGKSGVEHSISIADRRLAKIIQRCQALPGQQLFRYVDDAGDEHDVGSDHVNDYLREIAGPEVTAKDFRTWAGTMLAAQALREIGPGDDAKDMKANVVQAIDRVAKRLGNTRAVCRKYYVHPVVLEAYEEGEVIPPEPPRPKGDNRKGVARTLRGDEVAVLKLIARHA